MRALLLVRRGAPLTAALVDVLRRKGFEPVVLSSLPADGGAAFRALCADIDVRCVISAGVAVTADEALTTVRGIDDCAFAITMADSQRTLMAEANGLLGAHDVSPAALRSRPGQAPDAVPALRTRPVPAATPAGGGPRAAQADRRGRDLCGQAAARGGVAVRRHRPAVGRRAGAERRLRPRAW